jgi:hypothetical protein
MALAAPCRPGSIPARRRSDAALKGPQPISRPFRFASRWAENEAKAEGFISQSETSGFAPWSQPLISLWIRNGSFRGIVAFQCLNFIFIARHSRNAPFAADKAAVRGRCEARGRACRFGSYRDRCSPGSNRSRCHGRASTRPSTRTLFYSIRDRILAQYDLSHYCATSPATPHVWPAQAGHT